MKYKNIKNIQKLTKETNSFFLEVDIDFNNNGEYETVTYCARPNGGGLCDNIINDILNNKFEGKITNYKYPTAAELKQEKIKEIKAERDGLLAQSDWTQLPDVPDTTKVKWANYRQKLRDVPTQKGFPDNIVWPIKPK